MTHTHLRMEETNEVIQALQGALALIESLAPALITAAIHGEDGTPELRELNRNRIARIHNAISILSGTS